jgi:hypothetical protein
MAHFRFRRSFGNVNGRMFRGARPLMQYLLNLYRGAAAAYSLRSLSRAWIKEPVVEVRRASDDTTKSFTADDIGDGTMEQWVNATVALPLDTAGTGLPLDTEFVDFDGVDDYVELLSGVSLPSDFTISMSYKLDTADTVTFLTGGSCRFAFVGGEQYFINIGSAYISFTSQGGGYFQGVNRNLTLSRVGDQVTIVDGDYQETKTVSSDAISPSLVGAQSTVPSGLFKGSIWSLNVNGQAAYDGYGATPWNDTIGTNHGTVYGTPTTTTIGAAAAYSLRNLSTSYSGNVVNVRRGDGTTADFTAADVADGFDGVDDYVDLNHSFIPATGDFDIRFKYKHETPPVNNAYIFTQGSAVASFFGVSLLINGDCTFFPNGTTSGFISGGTLTVGQTYEIKMTRSGDDFKFFVDDVDKGTVTISSHTIPTDTNTYFGQATWTTGRWTKGSIYDIEKGGQVYYQGYGNTDADWLDQIGTNHATVFGTPATNANGYVTKWYDQSGNANHAVQATPASQPKIVDAGSLVTYNGQTCISNHAANSGVHLEVPISIRNSTFDMFATYGADTTETKGILLSQDNSGTGYLGILELSSASAVIDELATVSYRKDGADFTGSTRGNVYTTYHTNALTLVNINGTTGDYANWEANLIPFSYYTATMYSPKCYYSELIIYDSDQTDNRKAIESNMADYYGNIDLPAGFDSGNNEVDGFVATWYDQSGNANHAVQNVATSQPKIVDNGSLVANGIRFDGHHLSCGSLLSGDQSRSTFTIAAPENDQFFHSFGTLNYNGSMWSLSSEVAMRCKAHVWVSSTPATYFQNNLITNTYSGGSLFSTNAIYLNGNTVTRTSGTDGTVNTDPLGDFKIASLPSGSSSYVGAISEIIIYDSDQSAKRTNIEGNINDYYEIFADETYRRPDGSAIFRPDGTSVYERP